MKIYTRSGDHGKSSLFSGERVAKNDHRIAAYGEVDELNSLIGTVIALLPPNSAPLKEELLQIQSDLFVVGAWLATTPASGVAQNLTPLKAAMTQRLEKQIDALQAALPELNAFILPGGHVGAALAQVARAVCRRTERSVIDLSRTAEEKTAGPAVPEELPAYLNRLSDYLFVVARYCNHCAGVADTAWRGSTTA